ncbi:neurabin-1-like [Diaphorina citri]|uniref:Neurabin-1-like n=1 Tax=Diaphorina citri TaxID=121845 RepID=A0A3Q0JG92_DIACI|nr:neurabin-1-like [Diaphorina citri]
MRMKVLKSPYYIIIGWIMPRNLLLWKGRCPTENRRKRVKSWTVQSLSMNSWTVPCPEAKQTWPLQVATYLLFIAFYLCSRNRRKRVKSWTVQSLSMNSWTVPYPEAKQTWPLQEPEKASEELDSAVPQHELLDSSLSRGKADLEPEKASEELDSAVPQHELLESSLSRGKADLEPEKASEELDSAVPQHELLDSSLSRGKADLAATDSGDVWSPPNPQDSSPYLSSKKETSYHWQNVPVPEWSKEQVCQWLMALGLEAYTGKFFEAPINGISLLQLERNDFKALGVQV